MTEAERELLQEAEEAARHAYAPYSGYAVGAALRTVQGKVYTGCNVENSSYGLTICAERVALVRAIADGERKFEAIAIWADPPGMPCGACRQVLAEFAPNLKVICGHKETVIVKQLGELFPFPFSLETDKIEE